MKEIIPIKQLNAYVSIPGSKSITHRAIIAASLAHGKSCLYNCLESEDTRYTAAALRELGVEILNKENGLIITGNRGLFPALTQQKDIYMGNSGTSFRLLLSVAALAQGKILMTGTDRMLKRPIGALVRALKQLNVDVSCIHENDCPPVLVRASGIFGGKTEIAGDQSSQYLSSLLLSGPCAKQGVEIDVTGRLVSSPYVDITLDVMDRFGIKVEREGYRHFRINPGQTYQARDYAVEGDASSASYFWAAAAVTGGTVITKNIYPLETRQGDMDLLEVLSTMGCTLQKQRDNVTVHGNPLSGVDVDMGAMPDMVPTLAAIALFAKGTTHIKNVHHLRIKESDRLQAISLEWKKLGAHVEEKQDGLIIHGGVPLKGAIVEPHDDHRIAMALAVIGSKVPGIRIKNPECVSKSFPEFWDQWENIMPSIS